MYIEPIYLNDCDDVELLAWICIDGSYDQALERMNGNQEDEEFCWDIDEALEERFGCDFAGFRSIVERLLPMTTIVESMINGEKYHAFVVNDDAIVKARVNEGTL